MAGAPVVAPITAEAPSRIAPIPQPTTIAACASPTEPAVVAISAPVSGPNRLMPRLPHRANWSVNPSGRGGSVVRVSGASVRDARRSAVRTRWSVMERHCRLPTPALPGQVRSVGGPALSYALRPLSPPMRCELPKVSVSFSR